LPKHRLLFLPIFALVAAFAFAACGSSESDEDKIVDVIETSATSDDPAECVEFATQAFLEQSESEEGKDAVKSCEEDAKDTSGNPDSVTVTKVEVDGTDATANAAFVGGSFDGQTLTVALVEEDGDWRLDQITGFAKFDQGKLVQAFEDQFAEEEEDEGSLEPELVSCVIEALEESSQSEFEELLLSGSSEGFVEIAEACQE
jgi:hypothetical protein